MANMVLTGLCQVIWHLQKHSYNEGKRLLLYQEYFVQTCFYNLVSLSTHNYIHECVYATIVKGQCHDKLGIHCTHSYSTSSQLLGNLGYSVVHA